MTPTYELRHVPTDPLLRWQWFGTVDGITDYLAGFSSEEAAIRYGVEQGFIEREKAK